MPDRNVVHDRVDFERIEALAIEAGAIDLAREAREFGTRTAAGRLFVTCLGQFKRGKSTLLNALVGADVLPVGIVPVTSVVTLLKHGPALAARVRYTDSRSALVPAADLADYVSEQRNPTNGKEVAAVEVTVPSPLLERGLILVDTPGVGSVWVAGTEETRRFVPQVDAALIVLGADPPITGDELALVEAVAQETSALFVALNKADKASAHDIEEARAFTLRVIEERLHRQPRVFVVSAIEGRQQPTRDWPQLVAALRGLTEQARDVVAHRSRRVAMRALRQLRSGVIEQRQALLRPVEETTARVEALRAWIVAAESELRELSSRLTGQQMALDPVFAELRTDFVRRRAPAAAAELERELRGIRGGLAFARVGFETAGRIGEAEVRQWLDAIEPVAAKQYSEVTARFAALANDLLRSLGDAEPALRDLPLLEPDTDFRLKRGFFFASLTYRTRASWLWTMLASLGVPGTRDRLGRRASRYLEQLLEVNSSRVYEDLRYRVAESRRRVESDVRARLSQLSESASRALARASDVRQQGDDAVRAEASRLASLVARIDALLETVTVTSSGKEH
jgi:GTP-binding protein EngB required for normal cell division